MTTAWIIYCYSVNLIYAFTKCHVTSLLSYSQKVRLPCFLPARAHKTNPGWCLWLEFVGR